MWMIESKLSEEELAASSSVFWAAVAALDVANCCSTKVKTSLSPSVSFDIFYSIPCTNFSERSFASI